MNQPTEPTRVVTIKETRLTLPDLIDDLLWPKLFRTASLGLQPARIAIAFLTLALVGAIGSISAIWDDTDSGFNARLSTLWASLRIVPSDAPASSLLSIPSNILIFIGEFPLEVLLLGIPMLAVFSLGMGAISRMAACEFSAGITLSTTQALTFTARRWLSYLGAVFTPLLFVAAILLTLAIAGTVLLQLPGLNIVGSLLYPIALFLSLLALLAIGGYLLGFPLLIPAVSCEGTDAIDAFQRMYAYVVGRPGRLVLNTLILLILLWIIAILISVVVGGSVLLCAHALGAWTDENAQLIAAASPDLAGTAGVASGIVRTWIALAGVIGAACLFSCFSSGCTILYLIMRQHCDGQDWAELWFPGATDETIADANSTPQAPASARAVRNASPRSGETRPSATIPMGSPEPTPTPHQSGPISPSPISPSPLPTDPNLPPSPPPTPPSI